MASALDGLRILEVSVSMSAAIAGMVLAENGAEVIKIEPPEGDRLRGTPGFLSWHRGKKSIVLDLTTAEGRAKLKALAATAEGLIEDLPPRQVAKMGLDYETLKLVNPSLVYAAITSWGERGRYRDLPGYEGIVSAKTGRMASQQMAFRPGPIFTPTPIASYGAGMLAIQGLLAAMVAREKTGKGQRVHTSMVHALTAYDMGGFAHRSAKNDQATGPVVGVMPLAFMTALCKDGRYIQMCSRQPHLFRNWMRCLGLEHLYDDPGFKNMPDVFPSPQDMAAVLEMVEAKMKEKTMDEWLEIFTKNDVGGDPFLGAKEFLNTPQAVANGRRQVVIDPTVGKTIQCGPLANFSDTPAKIGVPAPALGQHTQEVLGALRSNGHARSPSSPLLGQGVPVAVSGEGPGVRFPKRPLEGITVVECAYFYAAPFSMTLLAEMGARIIKIEPPEGDPMRRNYSSTYNKSGVGKESVIADLKTPEGRKIVHQLVAKADIFLHNFRPKGTPEKLQIDYKTLSAINRRLVYLYGSCYGSNGPWAMRPGFHSTPNAIAGSGILESGRGNPPRDRVFPDPAGALGAGAAAMIGLTARNRTGKGQYLETMMINSLAYVVSRWNIQYDGKPEDPMPDKGQHGFHAAHRLYQLKQGWLYVECQLEEEWQALAKAVGLSHLVADPRFAVRQARLANDEALVKEFQAALDKRSAEEWETVLLKGGVAAVRADGVEHPDFMLNDPHVRDNGLAIPAELDDGRKFWRSSSCVEFSDMPPVYAPIRPLGWATGMVLRELGYTERQIDEMTERGITRAVGTKLPTG